MSLDLIGTLAQSFGAEITPPVTPASTPASTPAAASPLVAPPKLFAAFAKPAPTAPGLSAPPQLAPAFAPAAKPILPAQLRIPPPAVMTSRIFAPRASRAAAQEAKAGSWLPWVLVGTGVVVAGAGWYVMTKGIR